VPLTWRDAARTDRRLLQGFQCTIDFVRDRSGRPRFHARPWELDVQSHLRRTAPPHGPDQRLRLGLDEAGTLAAVTEQARVVVEGSISVVKLQALAVSAEVRGQGGRVADDALDDALSCSVELASASAAAEVLVIGWVDPRNRPSRELLARAGFGLRGDAPGGLEEWVVMVKVTRS